MSYKQLEKQLAIRSEDPKSLEEDRAIWSGVECPGCQGHRSHFFLICERCGNCAVLHPMVYSSNTGAYMFRVCPDSITPSQRAFTIKRLY